MISLPRNELSRFDSGSKLKSNFSPKMCFTLISVLDHRSLQHLIASNYGEKIFQWCEPKARLSTRNIFTGCRVILYLKGKRFNSMIYLRQCGDHHKEMQLITYYAKCGCDTPTCPHEFHVDVENKMSWNENINSYFFFLFAKRPVVKTTWENCSRPLRSCAFQVNICMPFCYSLFFIICFIVKETMPDQRALSGVSL